MVSVFYVFDTAFSTWDPPVASMVALRVPSSVLTLIVSSLATPLSKLRRVSHSHSSTKTKGMNNGVFFVAALSSFHF